MMIFMKACSRDVDQQTAEIQPPLPPPHPHHNMFVSSYINNRAREAQSHLEHLARSGDYNAQLHHNLAEAHILEYETSPERIFRANAFHNAMSSSRSLVSTIPELRSQATTQAHSSVIDQLQQKLDVVRQQAADYVAAHRSQSAATVFHSVSTFAAVQPELPTRAGQTRTLFGGGRVPLGWKDPETEGRTGVKERGPLPPQSPGGQMIQPISAMYPTRVTQPTTTPVQAQEPPVVAAPTPPVITEPVPAPPIVTEPASTAKESGTGGVQISEVSETSSVPPETTSPVPAMTETKSDLEPEVIDVTDVKPRDEAEPEVIDVTDAKPVDEVEPEVIDVTKAGDDLVTSRADKIGPEVPTVIPSPPAGESKKAAEAVRRAAAI